MRAKAESLAHGHGRVAAVAPSLIRGRRYNATALRRAADEQRETPQAWVLDLLDGGIESVEVDEDNAAFLFHGRVFHGRILAYRREHRNGVLSAPSKRRGPRYFGALL
jgi:hypothetical protein